MRQEVQTLKNSRQFRSVFPVRQLIICRQVVQKGAKLARFREHRLLRRGLQTSGHLRSCGLEVQDSITCCYKGLVRFKQTFEIVLSSEVIRVKQVQEVVKVPILEVDWGSGQH